MNSVEVSPQEVQELQNFILRWYHRHGRHELPWRLTNDPYTILVSELMLQQTQVSRVIPKFLNFIERFPTIHELSKAELGEVLALWQGLGYNRRAKFLWRLAQELTSHHHSKFPDTESELKKLPGIGPYTASAIVSFAFNQPTVVIETNIRAVFLYHFFPQQSNVPDSLLIPLIQLTTHQQNPREWYWALMDYGAHLKKVLPNPSRKSKHHTQQTRFQGSLRQVRGEIIRLLIQGNLTESELKQKLTSNKTHFNEALQQLLNEKLVVSEANSFRIP